MGPDYLLAAPRTALRWLTRHRRATDWDAALDAENAVNQALWNDDPPFTTTDPEAHDD